MKLLTLISILFLLLTQTSHGDTSCDSFTSNCAETNTRSAYPSTASKLNVNPSGVPTKLTPYGFESIWNSNGEKSAQSVDTSIIKGFSRIGGGLSFDNDNSFYSYNLVQAHQGTTFRSSADQAASEKTIGKVFNIGGAVALVSESSKPLFVPVLGLKARYNKITKKWKPGYGLSLNAKYIAFGLSYFNSTGSTSLGVPATSTTYLSAGTRFSAINFDYTYVYYKAKNLPSPLERQYARPMHITTAILSMGRLTFSAGYRWNVNIIGEPVNLTLIAIQAQISSHLALAYLHNYTPGAHSVGMQLFF